MRASQRRPWLRAIAIVALVVVLAVAGFGVYLAGQAGVLPGQPEPTRVPITPFADIPGFDFPTPPPASP